MSPITKKNSHSFTILWLLLMFAVAGCSPAKQAAPEPVIVEKAVMVEAPSSMDIGQEFSSMGKMSAPDVERIVIKNASLTLVVADPAKSMNAISSLAEEMGGFVVSANLYHELLENGSEVPRASITIRVLAQNLDKALERIRAESQQEPLNESVNSQDVTSEYTDLQSRLKNLQAAESQLLKIMEEAVRTEDVLAVFNQLVQVREQIEMIQGQIKYYKESAELSSISVDLMADEAVQPLTIGGWQPVGIAKDAIQALINALKFFGNLLIWVVLFLLPVLLILYLVFFLPARWLWKRLRRNRVSKKHPESSTVQKEET